MLAFLFLLVGINAIVVNNYCVHEFPSSRSTDYPLKHLSVIIRHGDRTPVSTPPCWQNSPDWRCGMYHQERPAKNFGNSRLYGRVYMDGRNENPGNCSRGQLTGEGYEQQVQNGKSLRSLYKDFLPPLTPDTVYLRSTDVPRTFLSLESLLYGLFPFQNASSCNAELIRINTMDINKETMTPNPKQCPRLSTLRNNMESTPTYANFLQNKVIPLEDQLNRVFNRVQTDYAIDDMFDCVQSHACHNYTLPGAFTQNMYNNLISTTLQNYGFLGFFNNSKSPKTYMQIAMAKFTSEVVARIDSAVHGRVQEKLAIFSGHDTTLLPLLMAFGGLDYTLEWPPYASMMRIELLDGGSQGNLIRVFYNNQPVFIPGCPDFTCPYPAFLKAAQVVIDSDSQCDRSSVRGRKRSTFGMLPELHAE